MKKPVFYIGGSSPALLHAGKELRRLGYTIAADPCPDVTHLLLNIPCREDFSGILAKLPEDVTIIGGNLQKATNVIDLLQDEMYLAENAAITAHCAVKLTLNKLSRCICHCPVLVLGWGRIAHCLAHLAKAMGAEVTIAARKKKDLAMAAALGFDTVCLPCPDAKGYRIIWNTVPSPILEESQCDSSAVLMDLASVKGISGDRVLWERGLPGREAPESSGILIAQTIHRIVKE